MPLVLKTQMKKKLNKIYSHKLLGKSFLFQLNLNITPVKIKLLFLLISLSLYTKISAQEKTIISGLENLHLSEGATMVTVDQGNDTVHYITSTQNIHQKIKTKSSLKKEKITFASHQKKRSAIDEKIIKKIKQKREVKMVYHTDAQSRTSFSALYYSSMSAVNNQNHLKTFNHSVFAENNVLTFLFVYQEKQNILFQLYHALKANNQLFTRPPPSFV